MGLNERFFTNTQHPNNGCGPFARAVQFHMEDLEEVRKWIQDNDGRIDSERSRKEMYEHAQWLIAQGNHDYYVDEENGIPFCKLPKSVQERLWDHGGAHRKWSKWTPEKILEDRGWEPDEVYWFSISKDSTYTYQLILKEGDWICRESYEPNRQPFYNVGSECHLPYSSDWEELKVG